MKSSNIDNQSFTFDNGGNHSSIKSPGSITNPNDIKRDLGFQSPFDPKMKTQIIASPNLLLPHFSRSSQILQSDSMKGSANFNQSQSQSEKKKSEELMKMLEDIESIEDDSYAVTKAIIKDKKAIDLEQGDNEKKKKRKAKLKSKIKNKGFKLDIPAKNRFIPEEVPVQKATVSPYSPQMQILQPTPTKIIAMNQSDTGTDKITFLNQLSNNPAPYGNMESPYINAFMQDSK